MKPLSLINLIKANVGVLTLFSLFSLAIVSSVAVLGSWGQDLVWLFLGSDTLFTLWQTGELSATEVAKALTLIPTMSVAVLAGGLLGVSSTLLQVLAKNPLASDSTLAVGSGAQMALLLATLFVPSLGLYGSFWLGFMGALASMGAVFLLALPSRLNPVVLVLSGLIINILLSAVASVLLLYHSELTLGVMVWGSGVLTQTGWHTVGVLGVAVGVLGVLLLPVYRSLVVMALPDVQARSLGVSVTNIRLYITLLVAGVVAVVVAKLGIIGFVGLCGAVLAGRLVRSLAWRLLASFAFGGLILWTVSNLLTLFLPNSFVGAGACTALLGSPLIIYLLLTLPKQKDETLLFKVTYKKPFKTGYLLSLLVVLTLLALVVTPYVVGVGQDMRMAFGLNWDLGLISEFRLPRTLTAMSAGAMLAVAGVILQSLTRNPMASPEVLGISSAVAMGVVLGFWLLPMWGMSISPVYLFGFGAVFALLALVLMLAMARRVPSLHLLLIGIAISALMGVVMSMVKVSGDPRLFAVLSFLSGSTYHATKMTAVVYAVLAVLGVGAAYVYTKPLSLLTFGQTVARGRGLATGRVRVALLSLVALLSVVATFAVGTLSFVGLMTPHLASILGARTLGSRIVMSAILGAVLLVVADYVGRYVIFPYEIPAGVLASLLGGGYFVYLMRSLK